MSKRITQLTELTTPATDDKLPIVDTSSGVTKWISYRNLVNIPELGWTSAGETWAYASAKSITIAGVDVTSKYPDGTKIRLKQGGGYKYFYVTSSSFSTNTTLNLAGDGNYTVANSAITDNYFSYAEVATGYPAAMNANTGSSKSTRHLEVSGYDYVASGCVWTGDSYGSTRAASMTSGVVYIAGKRLTVAAVSGRVFTASKDVYVDLVDNGDGTAVPVYYDNTTNAASPSFGTTGGTMRIAIVVVGASNIAAAGSIHQGNVSFGALCSGGLTANTSGQMRLAISDSLGNLICNRNPHPVAIAGITRLNTQTTGNPGGSHVIFNGCDGLPFIAQANTNYVFIMNEPVISGFSGSDDFVLEVYLASSKGTATTRCSEATVDFTGAFGVNLRVVFNTGTYSGLVWLNPYWRSNGVATGAGNINADTTTRYAFYGVEKL